MAEPKRKEFFSNMKTLSKQEYLYYITKLLNSGFDTNEINRLVNNQMEMELKKLISEILWTANNLYSEDILSENQLIEIINILKTIRGIKN